MSDDDQEFFWCDGQSMSRCQLQMASILIDQAGSLTAATSVLRAATMLRGVLSHLPKKDQPATKAWNQRVRPGCPVVVYPAGRHNAGLISRTISPAIETSLGPVVLVQGVDSFLPIEDLDTATDQMAAQL